MLIQHKGQTEETSSPSYMLARHLLCVLQGLPFDDPEKDCSHCGAFPSIRMTVHYMFDVGNTMIETIEEGCRESEEAHEMLLDSRDVLQERIEELLEGQPVKVAFLALTNITAKLQELMEHGQTIFHDVGKTAESAKAAA